MNPPDMKGKYFNMTLTAGGALHAGARSGLDRGIMHHATRRITTHIRDQPTAPGRNWSFKYLKYWAGAITRTKLDAPVLTGPMSGCILCRYRNGSGGDYIAHIGTDTDASHPNTIDVKNDWTSYIRSKTNPNVMGRKPSHVITDLDVIAEVQKGGGVPSKYETWGYFTMNDAWALLIQRSDGFGGQVSSRIVLVRPMQLLPWASIPGSW